MSNQVISQVISLSQYLNLTELPSVPENIKQKTIVINYDNESSVTWYLLNYQKNKLCLDNYDTDGRFRSVLTDGEKIHIYSPPKSLPFASIAETPYDDYVLEELVEGTMINLFWNEYSNDWDIATKGSLGGKYSFYQDNKKTFRTMFLEAANNQHIEFEYFNKNISYSFVLQHPDNRIVVPFQNTKLVLVALYEINGSDITVLDKRQCTIPNIILPKTLEQYADYKGSSWQDLR